MVSFPSSRLPLRPQPTPMHGTQHPYAGMQFPGTRFEQLQIPTYSSEHVMAHLSPSDIEAFMSSLQRLEDFGYVPNSNFAQAYSTPRAPQRLPFPHRPYTCRTTYDHSYEDTMWPTKHDPEHGDSDGNGSDQSKNSRSKYASTDTDIMRRVVAPVAFIPPEYAHLCKPSEEEAPASPDVPNSDKRVSNDPASDGHNTHEPAKDDPHYFCQWCSDLDREIVIPLARMPDADRHVRQFHIDEDLLWKKGGLVRCPFPSYRLSTCDFVVTRERYNTMKDHIAREHRLPLLPANDIGKYAKRVQRAKDGNGDKNSKRKISPDTSIKIGNKSMPYGYTANGRADLGEREHDRRYGKQSEIKNYLALWYRLNSDRQPYTRPDRNGQKRTPKPRSRGCNRKRNYRPRRSRNQRKASTSKPSTADADSLALTSPVVPLTEPYLDAAQVTMSQHPRSPHTAIERVDTPMASLADAAYQLFSNDFDSTDRAKSSYPSVFDSTSQDPFAFQGTKFDASSVPPPMELEGMFDGQVWTLPQDIYFGDDFMLGGSQTDNAFAL